jgi:hypothetical protein
VPLSGRARCAESSHFITPLIVRTVSGQCSDNREARIKSAADVSADRTKRTFSEPVRYRCRSSQPSSAFHSSGGAGGCGGTGTAVVSGAAGADEDAL